MGKNKVYAVWRGREIGLFGSWEECEPHVTGFPNAACEGYRLYDDALERLKEELSKMGMSLPPDLSKDQPPPLW